MTRKVIAAVDDLFFASKIRATAEHLGLTIKFARTDQAVLDAIHKETPDLIVLDLHSQKIQPLKLANDLKGDEQLRTIKLVGFFSHVETALATEAKEAGFDQVLPRSAFTNQLAQILSGD